MKKIFSLVMILSMALVLGACGNSNVESSDKISIVATIFPEYDWVNAVVGESDNVEVKMLLDNGVDLHSYQPTVDDILKISTCDVFVYVGGESDEWVEAVLSDAKNKDMKVINLLEVLGEGAKEEEVVEGMQEEEHEHEGEEHEDEEEAELDEHVWLSLKNAEIFVNVIAETMCEVDKDNSDKYTSNANEYLAKLNKLDARYQSEIDAASKDTILVGDRFPFRYLVDDYNLNYYAAFVGCSAETEASFETVIFLANKVDELELNTVFTIENSDGKLASTIVDNTQSKNQEVKVLDSLQSVTSKDIAEGTTYLGIMESNLEILVEGLK